MEFYLPERTEKITSFGVNNLQNILVFCLYSGLTVLLIHNHPITLSVFYIMLRFLYQLVHTYKTG